MEYRNIQGIDKPVSRLLFGTASPAFIEGTDTSELLNVALDAGR